MVSEILDRAKFLDKPVKMETLALPRVSITPKAGEKIRLFCRFYREKYCFLGILGSDSAIFIENLRSRFCSPFFPGLKFIYFRIKGAS